MFVCEGNTDRSPMAEAFLNKMAAGKHSATSAGVNPDDNRASDTCQRLMKEKDLDLSGHVPRKTEAGDVRGVDLIIFLNPSVQARVGFSVPKEKTRVWNVEDPAKYRNDDPRYRVVRDEIEREVQSLLDEIDP